MQIRMEALDQSLSGKTNGIIRSVDVEGSTTVRFSTEEMARGQRAAILRDVIGREFLGVEIEPLNNHEFSMAGTLRKLPGLGIASTLNCGVRVTRTKELIADGNDCFCLGIVPVGTIVISRGDDAITLEHGDAVLLSAAETSTGICSAMARLVVVSIPSASLTPLVADIEKAIMRPISRGNEPLKMLEAYLGLFEQEFGFQTPDLIRHAANYVYDLVALSISAARGGIDAVRDRNIGLARLRGIKADITDNLGRADLTIDIAAARHELSPRYVRRLFEVEGLTFCEFLLSQRLRRAHQLLTTPRFLDRTISSIAFECGFSDLSYFNKTFRRAFGASPTEIRLSSGVPK
jgi:AraC-like DNA-binding protein